MFKMDVQSNAVAVLWDMDGTLIDSEPLHQRTLLAVLASVGVRAGDDLFDATLGLGERDVHAYCARRFGLAIDISEWIAFRDAAYASAAATLRARLGALEIHRKLATRGVVQAVVSNASRRILDINLGALGLRDSATVSVSRSNVRLGKPDPEPYLHAARLLGVQPAHALVIEDSPTGAAAGLAAGMRVLVWPPADVPFSEFPAMCRSVASAKDLADFLSANVKGTS